MKCDRCPAAATHEIPHAVGEPHRYCDDCFAAFEERVAVMKERIVEFGKQVAAIWNEK